MELGKHASTSDARRGAWRVQRSPPSCSQSRWPWLRRAPLKSITLAVSAEWVGSPEQRVVQVQFSNARLVGFTRKHLRS